MTKAGKHLKVFSHNSPVHDMRLHATVGWIVAMAMCRLVDINSSRNGVTQTCKQCK